MAPSGTRRAPGAPDHRGPISIHASKKLGPRERDFCQHALVARACGAAGLDDPARQLPRSSVVATAHLVAVHRTEEERTFGFYDDGRFAWELADVVALDPPVRAVGRHAK